jgi:hypothetical protein
VGGIGGDDVEREGGEGEENECPLTMALSQAVRSGDLKMTVCIETASTSQMLEGCSRVAYGSPT